MSQTTIKIDSAEVQRVFKAYPVASMRRLTSLMEGSAIDLQNEMRKNAPTFDGQLRKSIRYTMSPAKLEARIGPHLSYAEAVEKGSKPHWTSVKEGTPLRKWADAKGISPYAIQGKIAKEGTKANPFVKKTFASLRVQVRRDITNGFGAFLKEVDRGRI